VSTPPEVLIREMADELDRLRAELDLLKRWAVNRDNHGLKDLVSGTGNQRYMGNKARIDPTGIQALAYPDEQFAIWFLSRFHPVPSTVSYGSLSGSVSQDNGSAQVFLRAKTVSDYARLGVFAEDATSLYYTFSDGPFSVNPVTGDPATLQDSWVWYLTTTDKFRGRANGATDNFAMEGWVSGAFVPLGANWTDLTDGGATTLHSHAGGGMNLLVKEADETVNNSSVLQDDNEILFAVAANEVWQFEGVLNISVITDTTSFKMTFTGPSGAVGSFSAIRYTSVGAIDSDSGNLGTSISMSAGVGRAVYFWGGIHNGANAGNLTLQWAQNSAAVEDTKVLAGSYIKWQAET